MPPKSTAFTAFVICIVATCLLGLFLGLFTRDPENAKERRGTTAPRHTAEQSTRNSSSHKLSPEPVSLKEFKIVAPGENIQVSDLQVHIATAVHYEQNPIKNAFDLFLNGWARHNDTKDFVCCLLRTLPTRNGGNITYTEVKSTLHNLVTTWIVDMQNAEFTCHISRKQLAIIGDADFKYVTFAKESCHQAPLVAMEILRPKPVPNSIGLCLKITYGKLNPEKMVEWFEYTRIMGVTKVFTYYFDVEPYVYKVLEYYRSIGYLDLLLIHPAKSKYGKDRGFRHPRWSEQSWVDEVMAANDCKHRMAGFDYVIVMDIDEFIVPKGHLTSYFDVLKRAERKEPDAACFRFDSQIVMPDWGISRKVPLHMMQYTQRTVEPNYDGVERNVRWGFRPNATHWVLNNYCYPHKPYKAIVLPEPLYTFLHYRGCKRQWKGCVDRAKVDDRNVTKYEISLVDRILNLPTEEVLPNYAKYIDSLKEWRKHVD